jgi:hypothetical protein
MSTLTSLLTTISFSSVMIVSNNPSPLPPMLLNALSVVPIVVAVVALSPVVLILLHVLHNLVRDVLCRFVNIVIAGDTRQKRVTVCMVFWMLTHGIKPMLLFTMRLRPLILPGFLTQAPLTM